MINDWSFERRLPSTNLIEKAFFGLCLLASLAIQGAIPFIAIPTTGQAIWLLGFAQSFANQGLFDIHAINFGGTEPAAISFGLSAALPASLLLRLGLEPALSYTLVFSAFFTLAFYGAWRLCRNFGLAASLCCLMALLWLTLPVVWQHGDYSALSLNFALIPTYYLAALNLLGLYGTQKYVKAALLYVMAAMLAVFMGGYVFVMFFVAGSITFFLAGIITGDWRSLFLRVYSAHALAFVLSYICFTQYIGMSVYPKAPLDFFRGWAIDLSFLLAPTQGLHWFWDVTGLSVARPAQKFFGDASVWRSSFITPLAVIAVCGAVYYFKQLRSLAAVFALIAFTGLYLSLGPDLKVFSYKPEGVKSLMMEKQYAVFPTGSSLISEHIPGFNNMRASYRWIGLSALGFWLLLMLAIGQMSANKNRMAMALLFLLIVAHAPPVHKKMPRYVNNLEAMGSMDDTITADLKKDTQPGEHVTFLPWGNDFFVNYLAARADIRTFNIGGDKNLAQARRNWPEEMLSFKMRYFGGHFVADTMRLLESGKTDTVLLPYLDLLWAPHAWPAPLQYKVHVDNLVKGLREKYDDRIQVQESTYYVLITLKDTVSNNTGV